VEADWEFEVGGDAPVIDALWPGFVDLRWTPQSVRDLRARVRSLPETIQLPELASTLEMLNAEKSPVWTSKCDFWPTLRADEFDSDELDAPVENFAHASGCYIDLLPKGGLQWTTPQIAAASCSQWCIHMHAIALRSCRADLVVRRSLIAPDQMGFGVTAYITACGSTTEKAMQTLEEALAAFAGVLCAQSTLQ
jgi:hypothetical protein